MGFVKISNLNVWYGKKPGFARRQPRCVEKNCIYAFIGPSGCGKTTLLRSINRLNDFVPGFRLSGSIEIDGKTPTSTNEHTHAEAIRRDTAWFSSIPTPFPVDPAEYAAAGQGAL
jgi:phosphate transport system ATP-binding protein